MTHTGVQKILRNGLKLAVLWCFVLVAFGAFVRLSDAGLGCPDWPTCYGKLTWPQKPHDVASANQAFPERPVDHSKTWPEQVHRHIASGLGFLILVLSFVAAHLARKPKLPAVISVASLVLGAMLYIKGMAGLASVFVLLGLGALLLLGALSHQHLRRLYWLLALVSFQGMLGLWTVTLNLKPIVVTAHLMFGLLTLACLFWAALQAHRETVFAQTSSRPHIPVWFVRMATLVLIAQIFLGGWVSTNYAALACSDFPKCQAEWLPPTDFKEGFVLVREFGVDYEGGILDGKARTAVHLAHRVGAIIAALVLSTLGVFAWRRGLRAHGALLLGLLGLQITLGISNVLYSLPLPVAVMHNAVAALLLCAMVWLIFANRRHLGSVSLG